MTDLKLLALDKDDLTIVSAHMQDAVFKLADVEYTARNGIFTLKANRFVWEENQRKKRGFERRRAALSIKRVRAVRSVGIDREDREKVLSLLAVAFRQTGEGPEGVIELTCAAGATIALDVECIEVQLADVGGAWETKAKPDHSLA
ncbi:DUF2948 family protein [Rhizobium paknamense]|uniref:DUF2948 family protein n=1 Tax=Rhizobium paknamense TaxID=1206817 RepID=A0ABU0IFC8_9HYPH|nr:DUF2948 family protein [Rhizobium paknamense]MDQ0456948.1 hypothetical protein [Rhizobium paknamense]